MIGESLECSRVGLERRHTMACSESWVETEDIIWCLAWGSLDSGRDFELRRRKGMMHSFRFDVWCIDGWAK